VIAGLGIAFISAHTVEAELADGRLVLLDAEGMPVQRKWFGVRRRDKALMPASMAFFEFLTRAGATFLPRVPTLRRTEARTGDPFTPSPNRATRRRLTKVAGC
jgi:hypothetical protein